MHAYIIVVMKNKTNWTGIPRNGSSVMKKKLGVVGPILATNVPPDPFLVAKTRHNFLSRSNFI